MSDKQTFALIIACVFLGVIVGIGEAINHFSDNPEIRYIEPNVKIAYKCENRSTEQPEYKEFEATAYTHLDEGCNRWTKTEFYLTPTARIVAVDPTIIPLGSIVEIEGYGIYYAQDVGGAIKGNKIDIYHWDREQALEFGRRMVKVRVLIYKSKVESTVNGY